MGLRTTIFTAELRVAERQQMTRIDQPAAGAIFATVVHPSPARVDLAAYHHLGVEFEVAVRLGDDLPASGGPWTRASVADRVAACLPAFELIEDGDADYKTLDAWRWRSRGRSSASSSRWSPTIPKHPRPSSRCRARPRCISA